MHAKYILLLSYHIPSGRAKIEAPDGMQGQVMSVAGGKRREAALIQYDTQRTQEAFGQEPRVHTIIYDHWRLSLYRGICKNELFNLKDDPGEMYNLWDSIAHSVTKSQLIEKLAELEMDTNFLQRGVNEGFSGGEKKRNEILQMLTLEPNLAILDETDSGLDIDALKIIAEGVNQFRNGDRSLLVITHYQRLLKYIKPDVVHVLIDGQIVRSGGKELALELEEKGYNWLE